MWGDGAGVTARIKGSSFIVARREQAPARGLDAL